MTTATKPSKTSGPAKKTTKPVAKKVQATLPSKPAKKSPATKPVEQATQYQLQIEATRGVWENTGKPASDLHDLIVRTLDSTIKPDLNYRIVADNGVKRPRSVLFVRHYSAENEIGVTITKTFATSLVAWLPSQYSVGAYCAVSDGKDGGTEGMGYALFPAA